MLRARLAGSGWFGASTRRRQRGVAGVAPGAQPRRSDVEKDEDPVRESGSGRAAAVLSIDGGGIRGIIPAMVLAELERRARRPIAEMFKLIAGTSTGGILAIALTRPGQNGKPAWNAQQLVELYEHEGPRIFASKLRHEARSLRGFVEEKYEAVGLETVLDRYCGDSTLADSVTDVLVPAYEIVTRQIFFFDSSLARKDATRNFPAKLAARATSAAPTYFEPPVTNGHTAPRELVFVDGGVYANNPGMCAFAQAQRAGLGDEIMLVALGTGEQTRALPYEAVRHWGVAEWARPILHVVLDGVSMVIDEQLRAILGDRYWRFQTVLTEASDDLDDATPENIERLKHQAQQLIDERSAELDRLVELLRA